MRKLHSVLLLGALLINCGDYAWAWHDQTHLAIAKAAGSDQWYNAAGADMVKEKAPFEQFNHWHNNNARLEITPQEVLNQTARYNGDGDAEGHLYGAIIASLRHYENSKVSNKYADFNLAFCAHYLGDLSQPLHNTPYDEFNKVHHLNNDGIVEKEVLTEKGLNKIKSHMNKIELGEKNFEDNLAKEVARIANASRALGYRLEKENRDMSGEEAYLQLGLSASLLRAVLVHYHKAVAQ